MTEENRQGNLVSGKNVGVEICEVLGLDPSYTASIQINIEANAAVEAKCILPVTDSEMARIAAILKKYEIRPVAETPIMDQDLGDAMEESGEQQLPRTEAALDWLRGQLNLAQ